MTITTYKNFQKRINSTKQPAGGTNVTALLKESTSLKNPVFQLVNADFEVNYVKWEGHYYYVNDIVSVNNGIYELHCSMDDLASHKSEIGSTTALVERSSNQSDDFIIDNQTLVSTQTTISIHAANDVWTKKNNYVLAVSGYGTTNDTIVGSSIYYVIDAAGLIGIMYDLYNSQSAIWSAVKGSLNPSQYIISCTKYPFDLPKSNSTNIYLGGFACLTATANHLSSLSKDIDFELTLPKHPSAENFKHWLNYAPYSKHTFYFEPFGAIPIDLDRINLDSFTGTLYCKIKVDLVTGQAILTISTDDAQTTVSRIVARANAKLGASIPLAQKTAGNIGEAVGVGVSAIGAIGMAASGNYIGGALGAVATAGSAISMMTPQVRTVGAAGSLLVEEYRKPEIVSEFKDVTAVDNAHMGKPLCQVKTLSSIPGYIKCTNASVNMAGLEADKAVINNYLNSGFYYE